MSAVLGRRSYILLFAIILGGTYYALEFAMSTRRMESERDAVTTSPPVKPPENQAPVVAAASLSVEPSPAPAEQRAFRFLLTGDHLELTAVTETRGDFHRRRGPLSWQPGMLYGRLLDAGQQVLAEDTLAAPDAPCFVLDPHTRGADGEPKPALLTATGPVVFQLRMPRLDSATHLEIYRLSGSQPTVGNETPVGALLASILLPR